MGGGRCDARRTRWCGWNTSTRRPTRRGPDVRAMSHVLRGRGLLLSAAAAGGQVLATPGVRIARTLVTGSTGTDTLPADGGRGLLRYFSRFHPDVPLPAVRRVIIVSAFLRRLGHAWRTRRSAARRGALARRYAPPSTF